MRDISGHDGFGILSGRAVKRGQVHIILAAYGHVVNMSAVAFISNVKIEVT